MVLTVYYCHIQILLQLYRLQSFNYHSRQLDTSWNVPEAS
jgi:hypothetical protein